MKQSLYYDLKIVPKINISKLNFKMQIWKLISIYYIETYFNHGFSLFYKYAFPHKLNNQILKDDAVKLLHSICQQIWTTQQWPQNWKRSVFIPIPKKGSPKECSNYRTIALISHISKVMLKTLQTRLQQYMNRELPDIQAGFRKGRGTTDQIANIHWIIEKAREFQKNIYFCFIDYATAFDSMITINCGKFWRRWVYQTTWPASWETCMQVRKQQLKLDMEQQTGSK